VGGSCVLHRLSFLIKPFLHTLYSLDTKPAARDGAAGG
jgi:hypothetical protein